MLLTDRFTLEVMTMEFARGLEVSGVRWCSKILASCFFFFLSFFRLLWVALLCFAVEAVHASLLEFITGFHGVTDATWI